MADDDATAPHALLLPYPAQGHVIPFMELAHRLLNAGFAVTFVNAEFNHRRVVAAAAAGAPPAYEGKQRLRLVGVADGMGDGEDRDNLVRLNATMQEAMPPQLEKLLDGEWSGRLSKVTCVVVDAGMSWALDAAKKRGLPTAALWAASAAVFAVIVGAKKLIRDGVIDDDGETTHLFLHPFSVTQVNPQLYMHMSLVSVSVRDSCVRRKIIDLFLSSSNGINRDFARRSSG